jgi:hypothetical protein
MDADCNIRKKTVKNAQRIRKSLRSPVNLCLRSGVCVTFGRDTKKTDFFEFDKFTYATTFRSIGEKSANGFVKELKYERNNFVEYAVLKTTLNKKRDNLGYEYLVGKFINEKLDQYPCFVETYGLFLYTTKQLKEIKQTGKTDLPLVKVDPFDLKVVCKSADRLCILTQNIKDSTSIGSFSNDYNFLHYDAVFCLYQVYFVLAQLRKEFTHNDLNLANVLLYTPVKNAYIQYHFHGETTVSFKSRFIVKLIDYGRCFIPTALEYESKICAQKECGDCGRNYGLNNIRKDRQWDRIYNYLNCAYKNESADLRLFFSMFWENTHKSDIITPLQDMATKLTWGYMGGGRHKLDGTPENLDSNSNLNNVKDVECALREFIPRTVKMNNDHYAKDAKLGDLHIYSNKPMDFIPV